MLPSRFSVLRGAPRVLGALGVAALGVASCAGVQERLDLLRAKKIELIDDHEQTKLDVESELRSLRDRVAKLEADLAAAKAAPAPPIASPPAPASAPTPQADAGADAGKARPRGPFVAPRATGSSVSPTVPEIF